MQKQNSTRIIEGILQLQKDKSKESYMSLINRLNKLEFPIAVLNDKLDILFSNPAFNQLFLELEIEKYNNLIQFHDSIHLLNYIKKQEKDDYPFYFSTLDGKEIGNYILSPEQIPIDHQFYHILYASSLLQKNTIPAFRNQSLIEQLGIGLGFYDTEGQIISYNHIAAAYLVGKPDDFVGKKLSDIYPAEYAQIYLNRIKSCLNSEENNSYIDEILLPSGIKWFKSIYSKVFSETGEILGVQILSDDITSLKLAEQQIEEEHKKYSSLIENINSGIALHQIITDENNKPIDFVFLHVNQKYEELTQLKAIEIIGKKGTEVVPVLEQKWIDLYGEVALTGKPKHIIDHSEYRNKYWDIRAYSPSQGQFAISMTDITEIKKNEILVDSFFEQPNVIHIVIDLKGNIIKVNKGWYDILGYPLQDLIGEKIFSFIHPDDINSTEKEMGKLAEGITTFHFENRYRHKSGHYVNLGWSANANLEEGLIYATANDISERKSFLNQLSSSEEKFRTFINNAADGVAIVDEKGKVSFVNKTFCQLIGFDESDLLGLNAWDLIYQMSANEQKDETYRNQIKAQMLQLLDSKENINVTHNQTTILLTNSNQKLDITESVFVFATSKGHNIGVFIRDITEIKKAEKEIQSAYELLTDTEKIAKSGSWTFNPKTGEGTWSKGSYQIRKAPYDIKCNLKNHEKFMHPDDIEAYRKIFHENSLSKDKEFKQFYRLVDVDGEIKYIEAHYEIQRDEEGKPIFVTGIDKDVSDRVRAEKALMESEERFKLAMKASRDGLFDWNLISNEIYYSPGWKKMLGYTNDELPNDFSVWENLTHPDDVKESWRRLDQHLKGETDRFEMEFRMKHKNGHYVDILSRATAIRNEKNKPIRVIGVHVDISESKKLQKTLEYQKNLTQQYFDAAGIMLMVLNSHQEVIMINPKGCEVLGYEESEIIGKNWFDHFIPKKDIDQIKEVFNSAMNNEINLVEYYENPIITKNGEERIIAWHNSVIRDENGKIFSIFISGNDITEEINSKIALEKSEEKFRDLFEKSGDAVFILEEETIINCNEASLKLFGYTQKEQLIGKTPIDLSPIYQLEDEKSSEKAPYYIELARFEHTCRFEWKHKKRDGSIFPCEVLLTYIGVNESHKNTTHAVMRNISLRKQNEEEIYKAKEKAEENERQLLATLDNMIEGCQILDFNWKYLYINKPAEIQNQRDKKELLGKDYRNVWRGIEKNPAYALIKSSLNERKSHHIVNQFIFPSGEIRWFNLFIEPIAKGVMILSYDITETKIYEDELKRKSKEYEALNIELKQKNVELIRAKENAENVQQKLEEAHKIAKLGSWELDIKKGVLTLTDSFYSLFHTTAEEMGGYQIPLEKYAELFVHPDDTYLIDKETRLAIETNDPNFSHYLEHRIKYMDGGSGFISVRFYIVKDENGNTIKTYGVNQDITEKKIAEQQIIESKEKAEESDRLKSAFLANMSHEIRTPMNGILGFAGLLKEPRLEEGEIQQYVEVIERSGVRMLNIINDLIDISKIEAQQMEVKVGETIVNDQLLFLKKFFLPEAKEKNTQLITNMPLAYDQSHIFTDKEKLYAILSNLTKNAIKFTENGKIEIGYQAYKDQLEFYVMDTGSGIPQEKQANIFERFIQAETDHNRKYEGAGLGLAISKAYAKMLGGRIWIDYSNKDGTRFKFTILKNLVKRVKKID